MSNCLPRTVAEASASSSSCNGRGPAAMLLHAHDHLAARFSRNAFTSLATSQCTTPSIQGVLGTQRQIKGVVGRQVDKYPPCLSPSVPRKHVLPPCPPVNRRRHGFAGSQLIGGSAERTNEFLFYTTTLHQSLPACFVDVDAFRGRRFLRARISRPRRSWYSLYSSISSRTLRSPRAQAVLAGAV